MRIDIQDTDLFPNEYLSEEIEDKKTVDLKIEKDENLKNPRKKFIELLNYIIKQSQYHYELGKNLTIDEFMVFFKGRSSMRFYISAKPCKWGFKFHSLVDSKNHYL